MPCLRVWRLVVLALVVTTGRLWAQGNPTGTISGRVTDPDDLVLPGGVWITHGAKEERTTG